MPLLPPPEIQAPPPSGNLHSSLINYERLHLHVRSSARKLDKIDLPQFILSIFPRNGLPPMFYSWRHPALSFISNPQEHFQFTQFIAARRPWAGQEGGHPERATALWAAPGSSPPGRRSRETEGGSIKISAQPWAREKGSWGQPAETALSTKEGPLL